MLRLHIRHRTTYAYAQPVTFGRHRLVLRPREGHDLRILQTTLKIDPAHEITWVRDVYGNSIALVDFTAGAHRLDILSETTIERVESLTERRYHEPWLVPWPVPYALEEQPVVDAYRALSFPDDAVELRHWLDAPPLVVDDGEPTAPVPTLRASTPTADAEGMLLDLCSRVYHAIAYRRRAERGVQSPVQTLRAGSGSCRDMATLLMDAARLLGVASRFASGYVHGTASMAGRASTHAWTEIYLPALGWRGFDPTTGKASGLGHVATGVSQHPRGVMPVAGIFSGDRKLYLGMTVEVGTRELATLADPARR